MKILLWLILPPLILIFVAFAIANRHAVTLSLDPVPISVQAPLYGLVFAAILIGLLAGGLVAWLRAGRWRRQLREEQRRVRRLERELQAAGQANDAASTASAAGTDTAAVVKAA